MSQHSETIRGTPPRILLIKSIRGKDWSLKTYRYIVLLITFIAYACYHASRKPSSIVKSVLYPFPNNGIVPKNTWPLGDVFVKVEIANSNEHKVSNEGWSPFNGPGGTSKLGEIDVAFLACYSLGMYVAGHLRDTLDLRLFLTFGMMGSGIFVALFGMGFFWNVHDFWFYLAMQMVAGLFQAIGWLSVVAVISNWFRKRKRGLIMGIWNAHTSIGNICGSLLHNPCQFAHEQPVSNLGIEGQQAGAVSFKLLSRVSFHISPGILHISLFIIHVSKVIVHVILREPAVQNLTANYH